VVNAIHFVPQPSAHHSWLSGVAVATRDDEFEQFFLANYKPVLRVLTFITGDRERAVDATQEAFIKAHGRWSKIRQYDSPAAWVRRVAINASRDSAKSDRRRRQREQAQPVAGELAHTDQHSSDDAVLALLGELSQRQREVATLFYVHDLSVAETAAILGLSEGTVKSHLASARERLRELLEHGQARA